MHFGRENLFGGSHEFCIDNHREQGPSSRSEIPFWGHLELICGGFLSVGTTAEIFPEWGSGAQQPPS